MEEHSLFCREIPKRTTEDEIFWAVEENHETRHYPSKTSCLRSALTGIRKEFDIESLF